MGKITQTFLKNIFFYVPVLEQHEGE